MMASAKIYLVLLGIALWCNSAFATFSASECDSTKSCLRLPADCNPTDATCLFFSWKWNGTAFEMELSGGSGDSTYAAVGFTKISAMEDADVYYCTGSNVVSAVINGFHSPPTTLSSAGISNVKAEVTNGLAQCTFTRVTSITKTISSGPTDFNLSAEPYYILLAHGPTSAGEPDYHGPSGRGVHDVKVDMAAGAATIVTTTAGASTNTSTGQSSGPVVSTGGSNVKSTTTTVAVGTSTNQSASSSCNLKKGCFQFPEDCQPQSYDCIRFTWTYNKDTNNFNMQISGGKGAGGTYAGVAFGLKPVMENADLYYCTGNALGSGAITNVETTPVVLNISAESGITDIVSGTENGVAKCSFVRAASITKPTTGSQTHDYDLTEADYYILLAGGNMNGESLTYHAADRVISPEPVRLGASCIFPQMKIYGLLMFVAWLMALNF